MLSSCGLIVVHLCYLAVGWYLIDMLLFSGKNKNRRPQAFRTPGEESQRKQREDFTKLDKLHMALTELSYALNYCSVIQVWGHGFVSLCSSNFVLLTVLYYTTIHYYICTI